VKNKYRHLILNVICLGAIVLLGMTFVGTLFSLRNTDIIDEPSTYFHNDINITLDEAYRLTVQQKDEQREVYIKRVMMVVNNSIAHYWEKCSDKSHP